MRAKSRLDEIVDAANYLDEGGYSEQAAAMRWIHIRTLLFRWLEKNSVCFSSTEEALAKAICRNEFREVREDLIMTYTVGLMSEWDESFFINDDHSKIFKKICDNIQAKLAASAEV